MFSNFLTINADLFVQVYSGDSRHGIFVGFYIRAAKRNTVNFCISNYDGSGRCCKTITLHRLTFLADGTAVVTHINHCKVSQLPIHFPQESSTGSTHVHTHTQVRPVALAKTQILSNAKVACEKFEWSQALSRTSVLRYAMVTEKRRSIFIDIA